MAKRSDGTQQMPVGDLLLVDDDGASRRALSQQLLKAGHRVRECASGNEALQIIDAGTPVDVILLDLNLPDLSGYEVCTRLRERYSLQRLPVVMLSGRIEPDDVVQGFQCGANDYVRKPFGQHELLSRIAVQLNLVLNHRALEQTNAQLTHAQDHLVQQEKMVSLGLLSAGVAHEINNPNNFLRISAHNVVGKLAEFRTFLMGLVEEGQSDVISEFTQRFERLDEDIQLVIEGSQRINDIVTGMRAASRSDQGNEKGIDPVAALEGTVTLVRPTFKTSVVFDADLTVRGELVGHFSQLTQMFTNLLVNACQAIESRFGKNSGRGVVRLSSHLDPDGLHIVIADNGCGMTEDVLKRVFEPFFTTKPRDTGTGLGMSICKNIIDAHGGAIHVTSTPGEGSQVTLTFPVPNGAA